MQFNERLQYFRLKKGISEKDLGEKLSITESSIRLYERGKLSVSLEHLNKLADFFEISPKLLLGTLFPELSPEEAENSFLILQELIEIRQNEFNNIEQPPADSFPDTEKAPGQSSKDENIQQDSSWPLNSTEQEMVPVLSQIRAEEVLSEDILQNVEFHWPLSNSIISMYGSELSDYYYIRMQGNTMEPTIADQDIVLVNRQLEVANNELAIIQYYNENATIRRVSYFQDKIVLSPDNKLYSSHTIEKKDCRVLGKVLWKAYYTRD